MASSSRQTSFFGTNDWQRIYQTYNQADFKSYDYSTLRKSFVDYLRLNYPENFNDFTENSEFISLLDVMAYLGQGLSFRNDLNAREGFLDTAERRDSVIKLANLVSYTPKRNIPAEGFLKITSISTTEDITDINGFNLSNQTILYNDPANPNWLEQFNSIFNAALVANQRIGRPANTANILGVITSEYTLNIPTNTLPVYNVSSTVDNIPMTFELVSVSSVGSDSLYEIPPQPTTKFNFLYRSDRRGYGSANTGYFFYFKQGQLQTFDFTLQQQISNQTLAIGDIQGINNTDTWLWQINTDNTLTYWKQVESVYSGINQRDTLSQRRVFSVVSGFNDTVSYSFGDGVFSEIPVGNYRAYVRASNGLNYQIEPSEMQGVSATINYISRIGKPETLTFNLSLQQTVSTAQQRENLAEIKLRAPSRYYTQNRMVNGEDYSNFPFTRFNSIIKSAAINRSSIGISRNQDLADPTGRYGSVNSFSDDGAVYLSTADSFAEFTATTTSVIVSFLNNILTQIINSPGMQQYYQQTTSRYTPDVASGDGLTYWKLATVDTDRVTGYFYNIPSPGLENPVPVGSFSGYDMKYAVQGSLLKFQAPTGYYFDSSNRLVAGSTVGRPTTMWSTVNLVVGDGYNGGDGIFANGVGAVAMMGFVPDGVQVLEIIPVFSNIIPNDIIQQCVDLIQLSATFTLKYDGTIPPDMNRWSIGSATDPNYMVKFVALGELRYSVQSRSLNYVFGSVRDTRFFWAGPEPIYDPLTGQILRDFVEVLQSNNQPSSTSTLTEPYRLIIVGQPTQSDGYSNDFEVNVASLNATNILTFNDPDWFSAVTGYVWSGINTGLYVFFIQVQDAINLTRYDLLPSGTIVSQYSDLLSIESVKYQYPVGTVFYANSENKFYQTSQDPGVSIQSYKVSLLPEGAYLMAYGRNGLYFQYRHNSGSTTRVDPATTNIIDLYLVTQAYYTSYNNWLQDITNRVPKPDEPTMAELSDAYASTLNDYKMLSDTVVLNSVSFKPLFGTKAEPELQGSIKAVKNPSTTVSDNEIKSSVVRVLNDYFNINNWDFGATFYGSEMTAYVHSQLGELISSVVIVSANPENSFGDLYQINAKPNEIFMNGVSPQDVIIISALTPRALRS